MGWDGVRWGQILTAGADGVPEPKTVLEGEDRGAARGVRAVRKPLKGGVQSGDVPGQVETGARLSPERGSAVTDALCELHGSPAPRRFSRCFPKLARGT